LDSSNKLLVGVDEAGYAPNLGPLVVVAVTLEVPCDVPSGDLWQRLAPAVTRFPAATADSLVVDDSKKVYASGRGLACLERTALAWIGLNGNSPTSLRELWAAHCLTETSDIDESPWFAEHDIAIPHAISAETHESAPKILAAALAKGGFGRTGVICQIIMPRRFNALIERDESKNIALFQVNAEILRRIWNNAPARQIEVALDKHGGRNFYWQLLQQEFHETVVVRGREGPALSHYEVNGSGRRLQATFLPRADAEHMLVAAASMIAKYVRELCMHMFNDFWTRHVPGLKPTAGYPVDAGRFWNEIRPAVRRLGIPRELLWRQR
jgi:ribonuclease HII